MTERWWERDPARYDSELRELDRAGFRYVIDEEARAKGYLRVEVFPVVEGEETPLIAVFPDLYPWFRFEVKAPTKSLSYHQHPFGKTLCLLPRDTLWWRPESDRLAHFLRDRIALVLASGADGPARDGVIEDPQAEPVTDYYRYADASIALVNGQWRLPSGSTFGPATLGVEGVDGQRPAALLRGAVLEMKDEKGETIYSSEPEISARYPTKVFARWSKRASAPLIEDPGLVFEALAEGDTRASKLIENPVQGGTLAVRIGLFPEEHRWRGAGGDVVGQGWLVGCRFRRDSIRERQGPSRHRGPTVTRNFAPQPYLARVGRYTPEDVMERAPELRPLRGKSVAILGLGCIGAPSTLELARAGVSEVRIADFDFVDPATSLRWPRGLSAAGGPKTTVLEHVLKTDYPLIRVRSWRARLGTVSEGEHDDWQILSEMLDGADLLYDASAEAGMQQFLAVQARSRRIPYIAVFGTQGGYGGTIVRIRPGITAGCWMCYLYASSDESFPIPASLPDETGRIQPTGCADPTFVGAGFDLGELALSGVRTAVSTLSAGTTSGYPDMAWDIAVLRLRDEHGLVIAPTWSTRVLDRHPNCPACNRNP